MAKITVEIVESPYTKAPGHTGGEVTILGLGVFKIGERVEGLEADLRPLVDAGHARMVMPGEAAAVEEEEE